MAQMFGGSNMPQQKRYGMNGKQIASGYAHGSFQGGGQTGQIATGEGAPPPAPTDQLWQQGGGSTAPNTPYGGGSWGGQGVQRPTNPQMANGHAGSSDGVLQMQQNQEAARNTPGALSGAMSGQAQANGRYSVGPYGALVSPGAPQINPTTGAPMVPNSGTGGYANYSSMSATSGGAGSMADYNAKYNEAKQANESRYAEGMQGYQDRYNRGMANLEGAGQQELSDIRNSGDAAKATSDQRLQSLGLGGTTISQTTNAGIDRETNDSSGRAQERIRQQRLTTDAGLSGDKLGFLERRTDAYPDMGPYAQLAMSQASSSQGSSTGGSYGGNPQTGQQGGGQRAFINNSVGYGPITGANFTQPQAPTGVNLDYTTQYALNDPEYMKAFQNTPMKKSPALLIQRQTR